MSRVVVDYKEIYELEKEIRKINKSLEDMSLLASQTVGKIMLYNNRKPSCSGLRNIKRSKELDDLQLYLIQVASDFESIEKRISLMNGKPYSRTKKNVIDFADKPDADSVFYKYVKGIEYRVSTGNTIQLIINGGSYMVIEKENLADYQKDMIKQELAKILLNMTSEKESDFKINEELKIVMDWLLSGGELSEELKKKYDKYIKNAKKLIALFNDYGEEYIRIYLSDYTNSVAILESLKKLNIGNELLNTVIDEMILEYSNKFYSMLEVTVDKIKNKAVDISISNIRVLKVVGYAQQAIDLITGSSKYAAHAKPLLAYQQISADISMAYSKAIQEIRNGNHSSEAIKNAETLFDMLKNIRTEQYNHLIAMTKDSRKKATLIKELNQIRQLNMI